jgi:hypothetical protein
LGLPGLLWLTTRDIAYKIKGKDPEQIRDLFGIEYDWTPEEFERVIFILFYFSYIIKF